MRIAGAILIPYGVKYGLKEISRDERVACYSGIAQTGTVSIQGESDSLTRILRNRDQINKMLTLSH